MDLVILSTQGWEEMGGAGRPTHYLAREALARGHSVLLVEVVASRTRTQDNNFTLVNFEALGFDEHALRRAWFGLNPQVNGRAELTRVLDAFEAKDTERVVIYGDPFVPFVEWFDLFRTRGYKIVYDALDDFEAFPEIGLYFTNVAAEQFLVQQCDLTVAVSSTLVEKLGAWEPRAPIQLLRQGFDPQTFGARGGSERAHPDKPILGFWGHVNTFNVDAAWIEFVARARPQWQMQLIGPVDQDPALPRAGERLRALPNVELVGQVAHEALPRYLEQFAVALVPFPASQFNRARDPLKVYEYLAGYVPVVAANTPQLRGMPYVTVAETAEEFLQGIEAAVNVTVDRAVVDAYLADCTWAKRWEQLTGMLANTPHGTSPAPETSKWYADAALAPNMREYIARTEQLLQERTEYVGALENDARAKQAHIERLQRFNPIWSLKGLIGS